MAAVAITIDDAAAEVWHTGADDILEYEIEPAIGDGLVVTAMYDHPERGHELRHFIPEEVQTGRCGQYVVARDRDRAGDYRSFRLSRIVTARADIDEVDC